MAESKQQTQKQSRKRAKKRNTIKHPWSKNDRLLFKSRGFKKAFADFLESEHPAVGQLSRHQCKVLRKMIGCQKLPLGVRRCQCQNPGCHHTRYYSNTCQTRFCPICSFTIKQRFLERIYGFVLDCPYFFISFNLPFRLRPLALDDRNRRVVLACLQKAVVDTILSICKEPVSKVSPGFLPGIVSTLHTFNKQAEWHPHLHLVVTAGGVPLPVIRKQKKLKYVPETLEGAWITESYLPFEQLRDRGQAKLLEYLREAHRDGRLKFEKHEEVYPYQRFSDFLDGVYQATQIVHVEKSGKGQNARMTHALEYALRYLGHPPLAMSSLVYNETRQMLQWTPKGSGESKGQRSSVRLMLDAFALRMAQHIPGKQDRITGCHGLYAAKQIKRALTIAKAAPQFKDSDFTERMRAKEEHERNRAYAAWQKRHQGNPKPPKFRMKYGLSWRSRIKGTFGADPLKCPKCGSEMLMDKRSLYFNREFCKMHTLKDGQIVTIEIEDG